MKQVGASEGESSGALTAFMTAVQMRDRVTAERKVTAAAVASPAIADEELELAKARKLLKILDANKGKFPADFDIDAFEASFAGQKADEARWVEGVVYRFPHVLAAVCATKWPSLTSPAGTACLLAAAPRMSWCFVVVSCLYVRVPWDCRRCVCGVPGPTGHSGDVAALVFFQFCLGSEPDAAASVCVGSAAAVA